MTNIWHSIEAEGWSRGFSYVGYENLCAVLKIAPQSCQTYNALCKVFDDDMERAMIRDEEILEQANLLASLCEEQWECKD